MTMIGNELTNTLIGNGLNDVLIGGAGADALSGGSGSDAASYQSATAAVTASLLTPSSNTGDAAGDTYTSIEYLYGSGFNDTLEGDANANLLYDADGADIMKGGAGKRYLPRQRLE